MARPAYGLNQYATFEVKSYNGDEYNCTIWWTGTANTRVWTLAKDGLKISYESEKSQDKNSPILASKCTLNIMVVDGAQQIFLRQIRSSYQEKDVWITIEHANGNKLLWCGYFILDLEAQEDVSLPNETTLVAVDGISTLKEVPFIREYTVGTTDAPTFPYTANDTYYNAGWQRVIGNSTSWLKLVCEATGQLLSTDSTSSTDLEDYFIQTAFNWWNEDMDASPSVNNDPLREMRINLRTLYEKDENNLFTPPSVYQVVKTICTNLNMRFFYWQHQFHFVGIGEYNSDESGSSPYSTPVNIPSRRYYYTGSSQTEYDYFGNNNYSLYYAQIESAGTGLEKIAGTIYQAIPAIKKVNMFYRELAGSNYFNGYPLFVTHNTLQTPTNWTTDNAYHEFTQQSESNGQLNEMRFTDADTLAGFIVRIYGNFSNTSTGELKMETAWSVRAKPAASNWGDNDNYVAYKYQAATYAEVRWMSIDSGNEFPLANNQQYIRDYIMIPANSTNQILTIWDSSTTTTTNTTGNLFPTNAAFVGEWDFQFWTFTGYDNNATYPMNAQGMTASYSHGRVMNSWGLQGTSVNGVTPMLSRQTPTSYYSIDYTDAIDMNGDFLSRFVPVMDNSQTNGLGAQQIQVNQEGSDTFTYDVGEIFFGDGSGANSTATIQVWDGSAWVFVDALGKWGLAEHTWDASASDFTWTVSYNKKFQDLLGEEILHNQSISLYTLNGTTVLSSQDKFYSGSTKRKYVNPVTRLIDSDAKKYMMMRSTFNFVTDEWSGEWVQMLRQVPSTVTTNTQTWDDDIPYDPIIAM